MQTNINGFINVIESCINFNVDSLIYASSSSVYGANKKIPFSTSDRTDRPISIYAATKKANELIANTYNHLYNLKTTGLRFFTVYGEYGRPDMSLHKFVFSILNNKKINLYNNGNHERDFTYVKDVVQVIKKILNKPSKDKIPYQVFNVASGNPKKLKHFLKVIESKLNRKAKINFLELQPGDVIKTHGDITSIKKINNYEPSTTFELGIEKFIKWFKKYYKY